MPKEMRKEFRANGLRAHIRKRERGNSVNYEIRCRRNGYNISASGVTVEEAKTRFIERLHEMQDGRGAADVPKAFDAFALYYFENFRKRKVTEATYSKDYARLRAHILPQFGNMPLKQITPKMCQNFIDGIAAAGKCKTAEEVYSLINCIFKTAIKHGIIEHNPLDLVVHVKHERKHGKALTAEEEQRLLRETQEPYRIMFAIALYTGLRPNEYATARIVGNLIYARNSKRHGGREEQKRIPITPMLRPYIAPNTVVPQIPPQKLRDIFNGIFGDAHKLYDLRTTFYTRCQMCGVAPAARDEFVGHSSGELGNAYTDLPDEYLIQEGEKLRY